MQFNPVCIRLSDVLNSVFNLLSSNAHSKNIALTSFIDFELHVMADANMVNSMLINLVSNAIKFTHTGGKIEVKTELIQPVAPDSNQLIIKLSVTDNGIGIPKEQRDKLFNIDSHFTESGTNNETGAGLGLLLVKEMAEKLGGKLELQSQVGVGSTFSFTLPVCQPT
jgi:signal transduction histidine kinase